MNFLLVVIYILSAILTLLVLYVSIYKSNEEKTTYFSFFTLHIFLYILGVSVEITSVDMIQANIANTIEYMGISFVAPYFLLIILEYADKRIENKWAIFSLFLIPIFSFILVVTYPINGLFYKSFELKSDLGVSHLVVEGTIFRTILYAYFFILFLAAFAIAIHSYRYGGKLVKRKMAFLIKGVIIPLVIALLYISGKSPYKMDFVPISMIFVSGYFGYHILFKNAFITIPFARTNVIDDMRDGYLLIDSNNNYVDSNKVAKVLFPSLNNAVMGTHMTSLDGMPDEFNDENIDEKYQEISVVNEQGEIKYYNITKSIVDKKKQVALNCWFMRDITERKKIMNNLKFMASHDSLTKIYNRTMFFKEASDLFMENCKNRKPFAILMIDIDFFKNVNDSYGHVCGDKAIVEITQRIKRNLRKDDIFARYGGEEFVIFLEDVNSEEAYTIGEKLRKSVETKSFELDGKKTNITISIGVGLYSKDKHNTIDDILVTADNLLYEAKNSGRNKVIIG